MKRTNNDQARSIRLRTVVAYPAVTVALVVAMALALTPLGTSQVMALDAPSTPTETATSSATITDLPSPTTTDAAPGTTTTAPVPSATTADAAPSPTTADSASPAPTPTPSPTPSPAPIPSLDALTSPLAAAVVAPGGVSVDHHVLATIAGPGLPAVYLGSGASVLGASQFQTFRIRFQMRNTGTDPIDTIPRLEVSSSNTAGYVAVPETPEPGKPFHMTREWVDGNNGGTVPGSAAATIAAAALITVSAGDTAVDGHRSMSINPDLRMSLQPATFTEQEFTVSASINAQFDTAYDFRITDNGAELAGTDVTVASIRLGAVPASQNSPDHRNGVPVDDPSAVAASGLAYPLMSAATPAATQTAIPVVSASTTAALYPLASGSLSPAVDGTTLVAVVESSNVHGQCATCHRGHTARAPSLLNQSQQSTLCFSCHDGSAAAIGAGAKDVKSQYSLAMPVNVPEKREYYSHDAVTPISATPLTERKSECADCHSHRAKSTPDSAQVGDTSTPPLSTGWGISGPLTGVSGVSVVNGAAGEAPTYEDLDGLAKPVTREYQVCFKCHSGAATLTSNTGLEPSEHALDKAVEFNPANESFHPVEAAGKNGTDKMKASLAGTSPYKLWNFNTTSTVRCLNCHASSSTPEPTDPVLDPTAAQPPGAGGDLAPHTSSNRGILLRNYLDRELKPRVDSPVGTKALKAAYSAGDFALCFVCHAEEPFANATSPANAKATNFAYHGLHLTGLQGRGDGGTDVDSAGAGQGNAICSECHFRTHSTTDKVGEPGGSRLVKFAPNVQPVSSTEPVAWTAGSPGTASCTLTCHGYKHAAAKY